MGDFGHGRTCKPWWKHFWKALADESGAYRQQTDCSTSADVAQTETSMQNAFAIIIVCVFAAPQIEPNGWAVEKQPAPKQRDNLIFKDLFVLS